MKIRLILIIIILYISMIIDCKIRSTRNNLNNKNFKEIKTSIKTKTNQQIQVINKLKAQKNIQILQILTNQKNLRKTLYYGLHLTWISIVIFTIYYIRSQIKRSKLVEQLIQKYLSKVEDYPSFLTDRDIISFINFFKKTQYTMYICAKNSDKYYSSVKTLNMKRISDTKYKIEMYANDEIGLSKIQGILILKCWQIRLMLSKAYFVKGKTDQTDNFNILLYEGVGVIEKTKQDWDYVIKGDWAFYGKQQSQKHSGVWKLSKKRVLYY